MGPRFRPRFGSRAGATLLTLMLLPAGFAVAHPDIDIQIAAITAEIDRRARHLLPVDQIRVDPFAESSTGNPTARISVVKQLSPTWTFIVQSNLSAEREEVIVSRWYLAPGLFVEASRDLDGSYGVDLKLRRPY